MITEEVINLLNGADKAIQETYGMLDTHESVAKLAIDKINELELKLKSVYIEGWDDGVKAGLPYEECQELLS